MSAHMGRYHGGGGGFVATVHFMQRCTLPRLCRAHQIHTKRGEIKREDIMKAGRRQGARSQGGVSKNTCSLVDKRAGY